MSCPGAQAADPLCQAGDLLHHAVNSAAGDMLASVARDIQQAEAKLLGDMVALWTNIGTPTTSDTAGPVAFIRTHTHWLVGFLAVLGLLIAAGRLAWDRRGEAAKEAAAGMVRLVLVTGAATATITLITTAGDEFSTWIINQALGGQSFPAAVQGKVSLATATLAPGLMLILALLGLIAALVQMMLLIVRYAMLGLVAGMLPLASSMWTAEGKQWSKKMIGWGLAFCLYKPVASIIYAYALVSFQRGTNIDQIAGLVMLVMAVAALPAMMRFIVPAISSVSGGSSGGGAALAGAGVAMGARLIPSARGGGASTAKPAAPSSGGPSGAATAGGGAASGAGAGATGAGAAAGGTAAAGAGAEGAASAGTAAATGAAAAAGPVGVAALAAKGVADAVKGAGQSAAGHATNPGGGPDGSS